MSAVVFGIGAFICACLIVIAYVCLCLTVSAKERERIEEELFDKRFGKGDRK